MSFFRNKQTRKQNIGEEKTNKCCTRSWLKTIENNLKRFRKMIQQS